MGSTRDNVQAGPRPEIPVIAPNGPLSHPQALAVVAPRSSSLPLILMGQISSKPNQHNSPAPSLASRSFNTAISLKRAFAARRKKSDVDNKAREPDADSRSVVGSFTFSRNTQPRVEITASSASSPPQLASHVFTPKKQQQPTQKPMTTTNPEPAVRPLPPPPPPPKQLSASESVPSTSSTTATGASTMLFTRSHGPSSSLHPQPASLEQNRSSIIPMSPPIQPAISYLTMADQLHRQDQEQQVVSLTSRPLPQPSSSSSQPIAPVSSSSLSSSSLPPSTNTVQTPPPTITTTTSITTTTTTTSSASASASEPAITSQVIPRKPLIRGPPVVVPERLEDFQVEDNNKRIARPRSDSDGALLEREYADKRKSDSTISHYTIRPGAGGANGGGASSSRSSRPVSMADSVQSSYTIVPGSSTGVLVGGGVVNVVLNTRLSVVDPDYSLVEEDDGDSFKSLDDEEEGDDDDEDDVDNNNAEVMEEGSVDGGHDKRGSAVWVRAGGEDKVTPPNSLLRQKRRSMSLNMSRTSSKVQLPYPPPPPSASATELKHPSYSISEGFYSQTPSSSSSSIGLGGARLQPNRNQKLPAIPPQTPHATTTTKANNNNNTAYINPTFTYPTQRPLPNHPAPPPSFRQTAVSFTSSLAPAAGLARKAVEKVRGALVHMGSSPSSHGHGHGNHGHHGSHSGSISSVSISSGYSSSVSNSSTAPSSFLPNERGVGVGGGGLNLARTPSNQSSAATQHSSNAMHVVNIGGIKEKNEREKQFGKKKKGKKEKRMGTPCKYGGRSGGDGSGGSGSNITPIAGGGGGGSSGPGAYIMPPGPLLGVQLRGPMTSRHGVPVTGGVVFGRALGKCVRETAVWIGKDPARALAREGGRELMGRLDLKMYERRMLPAIVVRCAQHLLIWGVEEVGLFRIPGRAAHITRLRSEFDTGVDYDMSGCTPGDLDPHAVASVFKAYLRELPEHILTQKLSPYFDAAIEQESSATAANASSTTDPTGQMRKGMGFPSSQKSGVAQSSPPSAAAAMMSMSASSPAGFTSTNLRKPPSLSTLAMPSFSGMRPASHNLISALRSLITALPKENRDLLRTIVELIQATAKESEMTKMPLSNLLVVLLPSLNISTPLLKVLCEEERIWANLGEGVGVDGQGVLDVTRVVLDIRREGDEGTTAAGHEEAEDEDEGEDEDEDDVDAHRRWTVVQRQQVPTVYLDSRSQASSASLASSALVSSSRDPSVLSRTESSITSSDRHEEGDVMLSSSVESVPTPLTSSAQSSQAHLSLGDTKYVLGGLGSRDRAEPKIQVYEPTSPGLETGILGGVDNSASIDKEESQTRRFAISSPLPYIPSPAPPPKMENNDSSPTSPNPRRRSIPALSFPGLFTGGHSHRISHGSFGSHGSEPASPAESMASATSGKFQPAGTLKAKKPSLRLLFSTSKQSSGSLKDVIAVTTPGSAVPGSAGAHSFSSYQQQQYQAKTASMVLAVSAGESSSDSSVSTPISAVTAPGTAISPSFSYDERGSGGAPGVDLPPVLGTPVEPGPLLRSELGLEISPPPTATIVGKKKEKKERIKTLVGQTPIADWYSTSAASSVVDLPVPVNRSQHEVEMSESSLSHAGYSEEDENEYDAEARRRTVMGRSRGISVSSQYSTNHLGLDDEEFGGEDDWTKTVLLAADFELGRA